VWVPVELLDIYQYFPRSHRGTLQLGAEIVLRRFDIGPGDCDCSKIDINGAVLEARLLASALQAQGATTGVEVLLVDDARAEAKQFITVERDLLVYPVADLCIILLA
jgi:hypothetical protein